MTFELFISQDNIADPLSRLLKQRTQGKPTHGTEDYVQFIAMNATPTAMTTKKVEEASAVDKELGEVRHAIWSGCYDKCQAYAPIAHELCTVGQLVLRGTWLVLPYKLQARALALAHKGHLGIMGTKYHFRTKTWWLGMDQVAEKHVKSCHVCQIVARALKANTITRRTMAGPGHRPAGALAIRTLNIGSTGLLQQVL